MIPAAATLGALVPPFELLQLGLEYVEAAATHPRRRRRCRSRHGARGAFGVGDRLRGGGVCLAHGDDGVRALRIRARRRRLRGTLLLLEGFDAFAKCRRNGGGGGGGGGRGALSVDGAGRPLDRCDRGRRHRRERTALLAKRLELSPMRLELRLVSLSRLGRLGRGVPRCCALGGVLRRPLRRRLFRRRALRRLLRHPLPLRLNLQGVLRLDVFELCLELSLHS